MIRTFANPDPDTDDGFGKAVAVVGPYLLVGAALDDTGATDAGAAYLFDGTTGALLKAIPNPDPSEREQFGAAVAISDARLMVGAPGWAPRTLGAAYLFEGPIFPDPPLFIRDPASQTVRAGQNVTFLAQATSPASITYRWQKDGTDLNGGTGPMISILGASSQDAGAYRCIASNIAGETASSPATLVVLNASTPNAAEFVGDTLPAQAYPGETLQIGVTMRDTSALSWSSSQGYALGAVEDTAGLLGDATRFGFLDPALTIPPGGSHTFFVEIHVPNQPGQFVARLQMVEELVEFFGATADLSVLVVPRPSAAEAWRDYE